jgi:hypothetical protein
MLVEDNGSVGTNLSSDVNAPHTNRLLPCKLNYSVGRETGGAAGTQAKDLHAGPFMFDLDPQFFPYADFMNSFFGNNGKTTRIHFAYYNINDEANKREHTDTLTGTHCWLMSISYSLGEQDQVYVVASSTNTHMTVHHPTHNEASIPRDARAKAFA